MMTSWILTTTERWSRTSRIPISATPTSTESSPAAISRRSFWQANTRRRRRQLRLGRRRLERGWRLHIEGHGCGIFGWRLRIGAAASRGSAGAGGNRQCPLASARMDTSSRFQPNSSRVRRTRERISVCRIEAVMFISCDTATETRYSYESAPINGF